MIIKNEKHFCCVCLKLDKYEVVTDYAKSDERDLDSRPYGEERLALKKSVQLCPYCRFSNFSVDYEIDEIDMKAVINSKNYKKIALSDLNSDVKKFVLAALLYDKAKQYDASGYFYLNAAWICDDREEQELAIKYRLLAAEKFEQLGLTSQTAEMHCDALRRAGAFDKATKTAKKALKTLELTEIQRHCLKTEISLCKKSRSDAVKLTEPKESFFKRLFKKK